MNVGLVNQGPIGILVQVRVGPAQAPAGDGALQEEAGVGVTLVVELGMEGAKTKFDLRFEHAVKVEDGYAVLVGLIVLRLNRRQDLLEAIDGRVRIELARNNQVFATGRHVYAVRAFWLGHEVE